MPVALSPGAAALRLVACVVRERLAPEDVCIRVSVADGRTTNGAFELDWHVVSKNEAEVTALCYTLLPSPCSALAVQLVSTQGDVWRDVGSLDELWDALVMCADTSSDEPHDHFSDKGGAAKREWSWGWRAEIQSQQARADFDAQCLDTCLVSLMLGRAPLCYRDGKEIPMCPAEREWLFQEFGSFAGHRLHPMSKTCAEPVPSDLKALAADEICSPHLRPLDESKLRALLPEFRPRISVRIVALQLRAARVAVAACNGLLLNDAEVRPVLTQASQAQLSLENAVQCNDFLRHYAPVAMHKWDVAVDAALAKLNFSGDSLHFVAVPVHPANVDNLRMRFSALVSSGDLLLFDATPVTALAQPTISGRTLMLLPHANTCSEHARQSGGRVKLPLMIQKTSTMRCTGPARVLTGPTICHILQQFWTRDREQIPLWNTVRILPERVGVCVRAVDDDYASTFWFSYIGRDDPLENIEDKDNNEMLIPLAAWLTPARFPETGSYAPLIVHYIRHAANTKTLEQLLAFMRTYFRVILSGQMSLLLCYGIALEAHQQNTMVVVRPSCGDIVATVVQDVGDGADVFFPILRLHRDVFPESLEAAFSATRTKQIALDCLEPVQNVLHTTVLSHLIPVIDIVVYHFADQDCSAGELRLALVSSLAECAHETCSSVVKSSDMRSLLLQASNFSSKDAASRDAEFIQIAEELAEHLLVRPIQELALLRMRLGQTTQLLAVDVSNPLAQCKAENE